VKAGQEEYAPIGWPTEYCILLPSGVENFLSTSRFFHALAKELSWNIIPRSLCCKCTGNLSVAADKSRDQYL
jgi:hypothetical protein